MSRFLRPHLREITPYAPGKPAEEVERELGVSEAIKLASNENPIGPSPLAVRAMAAVLAGSHRYPDPDAHELRHRLAAFHRVGTREIIFGHGSNELIDLVCRTFAGPGDHAVIGTPSFACYRLSLMAAGVPMTEVPLDHGLFWNAERLLEAVRAETRLLLLDNPNNPTSTHIGRDALRKLLSGLPLHVIPVIDEAYVHFADAPDYTSALEWRDEFPNLIVLRTFSKAYGLASARAGYGVAPRELIDDLERVRLPFNLNAIAQAGAIAALDDDAHVTRCVELNRDERANVTRALEAMGLAVAPSQTNFVCVGIGRDARTVFDALLARGVIVRTVSGLPRHLRISIGLPAENARMLHALREVLA